MKIVVYYDEDETRENREEVINELSNIDGVRNVENGYISMGSPVTAKVDIEFNWNEINEEEMVYKISTQPFIHNASRLR
jgi:hypothetical protein